MRRRLLLGLVGLVVAICAAVGGIVLWEDSTAVTVTFVNDSGVTVALPDCSTDLATIDAGLSARLPVASDHPTNCTVDDANAGKMIGCVTVPHPVRSSTVIRLSRTHACH